MAVKTPEYWKEYELVEETTAYGNKVMIPKKLKDGWESERLYKDLAVKRGLESQTGLELRLKQVYTRQIVNDLILTFWERYGEND